MFQELINDIFQDLLCVCVVVYMNNILVFSHNLESHWHVWAVLSCLRNNILYAKLEKCIFERSSFPFLGYVILDQALPKDPEKLSAVLNWPVLKVFMLIKASCNFIIITISLFHSSLEAPITAATKKQLESSS